MNLSATLQPAPPSVLNEHQIALRLGWSAAELVGRITALNQRRAAKTAPSPSTSAEGSPTPAASPVPAIANRALAVPHYTVGRTLTYTDDKPSDNAGISDAKKLWFLAQSITQLSARIEMPTTSLDGLQPQLAAFVPAPTDDRWRALFHAVETFNAETMAELGSRDPRSAKAYAAGKLLAQLFWACPTDAEIEERLIRGNIDTYTLLGKLETGQMSELIRDLHELRLPQDTVNALAAGISAWEIKGRMIRSETGLDLIRRPRFPGPRYTLTTLPLLNRVIPSGLAKRIKPERTRPRRLELRPDEARTIRNNLRTQSFIWHGLVFETRNPTRLLRASHWFVINFLTSAFMLTGVLLALIAIGLLALTATLLAGPAIVSLVRAAYGSGKLNASSVFKSLTAAPLLGVIGGVIAGLQRLPDSLSDWRAGIRAHFILRYIRQEAVKQWDDGLAKPKRKKAKNQSRLRSSADKPTPPGPR